MKYNGPFVRQPGMYDLQQACEECCITNFGPSLTQQSQAEEADINTIVKRFGLTGHLPENARAPTYGDFTDVIDFQTAMNAVTLAQESFMKMPASIRQRFGHDPQEFVAFCSDPENLPEMRKMGLATPAPAGAPPAPPTGGTPPNEPGVAPKGAGTPPAT